MVVVHKLAVNPGRPTVAHVARRASLQVRASGIGTGDVPPALPSCLRWRAQQARLTQVNQHIRTLERANSRESSQHAAGAHAGGFWYATAARIFTCLIRKQQDAEGPTLAERLESLGQEAKALDGAILRERIASLAAPEHEQLEAMVDARRPTSYFAPQLATFFAAQAMDDTGVAEAYLASLDLVACDQALSRMQNDKTFEAAALAELKKRARQAASVCEWQLDWLGTQGTLYDICTCHGEALKRWQRHFGLT